MFHNKTLEYIYARAILQYTILECIFINGTVVNCPIDMFLSQNIWCIYLQFTPCVLFCSTLVTHGTLSARIGFTFRRLKLQYWFGLMVLKMFETGEFVYECIILRNLIFSKYLFFSFSKRKRPPSKNKNSTVLVLLTL